MRKQRKTGIHKTKTKNTAGGHSNYTLMRAHTHTNTRLEDARTAKQNKEKQSKRKIK